MSVAKMRAAVAMMAVVGLAAWVAGAQVRPRDPGGASGTPAATPPPAVATVGPLRIPQAEFDQRSAQTLQDYEARTGSALPPEVVPIIRRQLLESLVRRDLLMLEAQRRGIRADSTEAEAQLKRDPFFQVNGRFDRARYEQVRLQSPLAYANALEGVRLALGARELVARLEVERGPATAPLRASAARALTRASAEYLLLRRDEFDGGYPEPSESEVRGYYAAHAADYLRPARAVLTVVQVDRPSLPDSEAAVPAKVEAWTQHLRIIADSVLTELKAGRSLADAAASRGQIREEQVVLTDNFPRYWRGDAATSAAVFTTAAGAVLPRPVPAERGWLAVRVDRIEPLHVAPLQEVSGGIRNGLREERHRTFAERELQALQEALRDSLVATAYRVRWSLADTSAVAPGRTTAADVERYYRDHLADFSAYDSRRGAVVARPLAEVQDQARAGLVRERRFLRSRALTEPLLQLWAQGRRDPSLERRLGVREMEPLVPGAAADTALVPRLLSDSVTARRGTLGPGLVRSARGWLVFDLYAAVPGFHLSFEQARPQLELRRAALRRETEEREARRLFEADPRRFTGGSVIRFTRAFVPVPDELSVRLSREEVERYHREHLADFSAPELVRASHILISPRDASPAADREARARADSVLERLRAGEDFAQMARKVSDDPATADNGGDLGQFGRGAMLVEVERAAFAMRAGDLSAEPVRSPVGYHILSVREYVPLFAQPLERIYTDVAVRLARIKGDSLAHHRADSLLVLLRDGRAGRALAAKLGLQLVPCEHEIGVRDPYPLDTHPYFQRLETLRPGEVLRMTRPFGGYGYALTWVDSIVPAPTPSWDKARDRVIGTYRSGAGRRALDAKRAELDSLMTAGWSFDSVAVAWGGLQRMRPRTPGEPMPGIGEPGPLDTLLFGVRGDDGLAAGSLSDWLSLPVGLIRVRALGIQAPDPTAITNRVENTRRQLLERALTTYFEELKRRYPVRILDRVLRDVVLPMPPTAR